MSAILQRYRLSPCARHESPSSLMSRRRDAMRRSRTMLIPRRHEETADDKHDDAMSTMTRCSRWVHGIHRVLGAQSKHSLRVFVFVLLCAFLSASVPLRRDSKISGGANIFRSTADAHRLIPRTVRMQPIAGAADRAVRDELFAERARLPDRPSPHRSRPRHRRVRLCG